MIATPAAGVEQRLIDPDEARRRVLGRVETLPAEEVPLGEALGRVLAEDVTAADAVPGFDNSAMDGFAVRAADTAGARAGLPASLEVVGESRAGRPASRALAAGEAIRISTGAVLPDGADAVVRVEDTSQRDGVVEVRVAVEPGRDVRRAGDDVAGGVRVLSRGAPLGPAELGVLASVGVAVPSCARRPTVAVLVTGDELIEPGEPLRPGAVRNANAYSVAAQATQAGADVVHTGTIADDYAATVAAVGPALERDVVVICGGMSVGAHDHVRPALAELGVKRDFFGVALRPGKPTWFGVHGGRGEHGGGTLVFGLPGNPVSAMVTFHLFARPVLAALAGAHRERATMPAIMAKDYPKAPGRAHAVRCRTELRRGGWRAHPLRDQGSHVLTSMLRADALAMIPADRGEVRAGEQVEIEFLRRPPMESEDPWSAGHEADGGRS